MGMVREEIAMRSRLVLVTALPIALVALAGIAGRVTGEEPPLHVTKCQLPDGRLYFGPAPPRDCETIAEYENGKEISAADPSPTPSPDGGS